MPSSRLSGPVEQAGGAGERRVRRRRRGGRRRWRRACRASPPSPAGVRRRGRPGRGGPSSRGPAAAATRPAMRWRTTASSPRPSTVADVGDEVGTPGPLRVPGVGGEVLVGLGRGLPRRPGRPSTSNCRRRSRGEAALVGQRRHGDAASRRPARRRGWPPGRGRRSRNTSLNEAWPFIWRSGRTSTPGWCIGSTK